jgi:1-phosphatidylinositol phosphodiesterase
MADKITIRNFSNVHLNLKLVERFDRHPSDKPIATVTSIFAKVTNSVGLTNNTTRAAVPRINSNAQPFTTRGVSIQIAPFQIVTTDIAAFERSNQERLRLSFDADDGRHQMYCPVPTLESADLVKPSNARHSLTGIYLTKHAFVALYSSSHIKQWMGQMPDDIPLSFLSIPGTHNSPTYHLAPPSVRCQAVSPWDQMQNGVRFFDLRVQPEKPPTKPLVLVHSAFPISLAGKKYFQDLYDDVLRFLRENPSETLVMSLKREGPGDATDQHLSKILHDHYIRPNRSAWYTEPRIPRLAEARSRIVLIRRYGLDDSLRGSPDTGIDASSWADNATDSLCPGGQVRIQDFYEVSDAAGIATKIGHCTAQLRRSGSCPYDPATAAALSCRIAPPAVPPPQMPVFVNFLSGSNFWKVGTWPEKIAAKVNPACVEWLCRNHMAEEEEEEEEEKKDQEQTGKKGCWTTGVVVCDWVGLDGDWDLVKCVVGMNARLVGR